MKELEKLIPKRCPGVSAMTVKEIIIAMIEEDNVISLEKCGQINIYWCFKNQVIMKLYEAVCTLRVKIADIKEEIKALETDINHQNKSEKCPMFSSGGIKYQRDTLLQELDTLKKNITSTMKDFTAVEEMMWDQARICGEQTNLGNQIHNLEVITDNIEILLSYLAKRCGIDISAIKDELDIPREFEEYNFKTFELETCEI
ncbi:Meiotic nuclear division protein 1 [Nakaseomyces bracarensis]|uniref:Meiotic nuclear division protein 1 n=1 Tax=Nakaseomyces bracarensis TaxID=273131 RepID=A0ABR4P083_9SACH